MILAIALAAKWPGKRVNWVGLLDRMQACYRLAQVEPQRLRQQAAMRRDNDLIDCHSDNDCKSRVMKTFQDTMDNIQKNQNIVASHYNIYVLEIRACMAGANICQEPTFDPTTATCAVVGQYASDLNDSLTNPQPPDQPSKGR